MTLPKAFYAEPRFRISSPDFARLRGATKLTLETPGITFALAFDYYRVEVLATEKDRDLACGPTAHEDVKYFATTRRALVDAGITLKDISCGNTVDHPRFGEILTPVFDAAVTRLIKDLLQSRKGRDEIVASTIIPIARARYTISVTSAGDWLNFAVSAYSAFEQSHDDVMDRTLKYLEGRVALQLSPSTINAKGN
ncbi:MAG: hypothetical protein Q7T81_14765 [Pseudolabrys sp.]|nr:hypothetical protein [Pseudolabrys sp.]